MEKKTFEYKQEQDPNTVMHEQQPEQSQFYYTQFQNGTNTIPKGTFSSNVLVTAVSLLLLSWFSSAITVSGIFPILFIALFIGIFGYVITIISIASAGLTAVNSRNLSLAIVVGAIIKIFGSAILLIFLDLLFGSSFDIHGGIFTAIWVYFLIFVIQSFINMLLYRK